MSRATGPVRSTCIERMGVVRRGGEDVDAGCVQARETFVGGRGNERQAEDAACGGAHGFRVPAADGAGQADDAGGAEGFGGAEDGAEVAGILDAGEDDDKCGLVWLFKQVCPCPLRRVDEGCNRLRRFGDKRRCQDAFRHNQRFGVSGQGQLLEPMLESVSGKGAADTQAGTESFFDKVGSFDSDEAVGFPLRGPQGPAQVLQARVLLTVYNA